MAPVQLPLVLSLCPTKSCLRAGVVGGGHSVREKIALKAVVTLKNLISLVYLHSHSIYVPPTRLTQFSRM